jgi:CubicO group peptidase (beta-lactamase class C family)
VPGTDADTLYEFLATLSKDPAYEHGEIFRYQTPKTDVVNWITNRATGKSFQDQMSDLLWRKLGTEGETYVLLDRGGTLVAGGGLNAAPRDLARFAMMMLNDGVADGQQVVPAGVIDTLDAGASREAFSRGPDAVGAVGTGDWSYRAQWWIRHTPGREAIIAVGINGQWIYLDRRRGVAIVKQSSQPVSSDPDTDQFTLNAFDAVIDRLGR